MPAKIAKKKIARKKIARKKIAKKKIAKKSPRWGQSLGEGQEEDDPTR